MLQYHEIIYYIILYYNILYYFEWKSTTFGVLRLLRRVYQAWPT